MLYHAPTGSTDPNAPYVGKNVAAGQQGSKVPPAAIELTQREIVNTISASGQTPTDSDPQQLLRSVRSGVLHFYSDNGVANAPAIAPSPAHTSLFDGLFVRVKMKYAPTGQSTLTINGLTAPVRRLAGAVLVGGEWAAGDFIGFVYSAAAGVFQIVGLTPSDIASLTTGAGSAQTSQQSGVTGLIGSSPGGSKAANWSAEQVVLATSITSGANFRVSNVALAFNGGVIAAKNGTDAGTMPSSADYTIYAIYNPTTAELATLGCAGSVSNGTTYTGTHMPTGFTASQKIWAGVTDGSGNLPNFGQLNADISIPQTNVLNANYASQGTAPTVPTPISIASLVPACARSVKGHQGASTGAAGGVAMALTADVNGALPSYAVVGPATGPYPALDGWTPVAIPYEMRLLTSQTIYWKTGAGGVATYRVTVGGYRI